MPKYCDLLTYTTVVYVMENINTICVTSLGRLTLFIFSLHYQSHTSGI